MSKREECRKCGAKLRHDKTSEQYDPDYCSGKCRKEDGSPPYVKSVAEQAMVIEATKKARPASFEDYKKNVPSKYARRFEAEKLNWSENQMSEAELLQAGFRANREPIPGDWDFEQDVPEIPETTGTPPNAWHVLKAKAKELGINTRSKNADQIKVEIQEKENKKPDIFDNAADIDAHADDGGGEIDV